MHWRRFLRRHLGKWCLKCVLPAVLLTALPEDVLAQRFSREIAGAVRMHNGYVLRGLCDTSNTLDPLLLNQRLELRRINQSFRTYFVHVRNSDAVVPDASAVPTENFDIFQRRTGSRPMDYAIGAHRPPQFDAEGRGQMTLNLGGGRTVDLDVAITAANSVSATVSGLSHRWQYGMSLNALPESLLYRGAAEPSLLGKVKNFDDGATRLNLIQMLIDAERFSAARQLIGDTERQFPETTGRCETLASIWNDRVGEKLLEEIAAIRDSGRPVLATHYAREYPDAELAPVLRVRARQFLEEHDTRLRRLNALRTGVHQLIGEIADDTQRTQATRIWADLAGEADLHTLADFAAWEVLWQDDTLPPESRVALAVTGRLLGANNAVDSFAAAEGLSRMRYLIHDYLSTTETETRQREQIIAEVRQQEGFTVERVAMLIQQLPPESPLLPKRDSITVPRVIPIEGDDATVGCDIVVPAEYSETRRYPLLIALPRAGGTAEETLQFWRQQTDRRGFLLAVPRLYEPQATEYDASAATHQRFRNLLRRLRAGLSVDDERIFIAGHEIGGEAAMDIAASQPNSFAGIISLSGLGRRHLQWTAHNTGRIPWYVVVGTRQPTYYERMELLLRKLFSRRGLSGRAEYCDVVFCRYEERGYESFAEELPDIFRWMKTLRRPPLPDYILAEAIRSTDRRWFWLELTEVENRFVSFDESGSFDRKPSGTTGTVDARVHGNFFRLPTLPGKGFLKLSPDLPEFDPSAEVVIRPPGGRTQTVQYAPSVSDLLEDFRQNGDRGRLCYMRIPIGD